MNGLLSVLLAVQASQGTTGSYYAGYLTGSVISSLLVPFIVWLIAAIWKVNRTYDRFIRFMFWGLVVVLISKLGQIARLAEITQ